MAFLLKKLSFFQPPFPRGVAVEIFWIWDQDSCWGKRVSAKKEANQPRDNGEKGHCSFLLPSPLFSSLRSRIFSIQLVAFLPHQGSSDLPTSDKGRSGDPQKKKLRDSTKRSDPFSMREINSFFKYYPALVGSPGLVPSCNKLDIAFSLMTLRDKRIGHHWDETRSKESFLPDKPTSWVKCYKAPSRLKQALAFPQNLIKIVSEVEPPLSGHLLSKHPPLSNQYSKFQNNNIVEKKEELFSFKFCSSQLIFSHNIILKNGFDHILCEY